MIISCDINQTSAIVIMEMCRNSKLFLTIILNIDTHQMLTGMMVLMVVKVDKRII
jgi:hypothetical protein